MKYSRERRSMLQNLMTAGAVWVAGGRAREQDFTVHSDVRLVVLDVSVRNRRGELISGLEKENFSISEDGRTRPITVFAHSDMPVAVGLLIDESSSMRNKRFDVLMAAQTLIEESNPLDEFFILNFNDRVTRGLPDGTLFTDNRAQLRAALHRGVPRGKTALNDAVAEAVEMLKQGTREKKAAVLISDGGDTASSHTRRQTVALVERSPAAIYCVGIYDEGDPDRDPGFLTSLASLSGGGAWFPQQPSDTVGVCRRIATEIRARYTLGFIPDPNRNSHLRHRLNVRVSSAKSGSLTAITRTSFYYEDPTAQIP